ncbi:MAG: tRNA-dihydrouridine synthase family protein [Bacteroidaceae bacterium]
MSAYKIEFAPVQGHTDFTYRRIHAQIFKGVDTYYTPFLRLPQRNKDIKDVSIANNDLSRVVPQIIGGDVQEMTSLIHQVYELGYRRVDINFGCPFRMVTIKGRGSGAFNDIEKMSLLLNFPSDMQVSLKLRLGYDDPKQIMELMPFINAIPLHSVAIHARLGNQGYTGDVDMDAFEAVYLACKHPLFYNGDVTTVDEALALLDRFPNLAGLMIGRGLLANPALADQIKDALASREGLPTERVWSEQAQLDLYRAFHTELFNAYCGYLEGGDHQIIQKMQTFWEYFLPDTDRKVLKLIKKCTKLDKYRTICSSINLL